MNDRLFPDAPSTVSAITGRRMAPSENVLGGTHRTDPQTSRDAAESNKPRSGSQRALVLQAVRESGSYGLTAEEAARATGMPSGVSGNSAAKRLSELRQSGWVEATGRTRTTLNGCRAQVFVAVESAEVAA